MKAIILAAGKGTRLGYLTDEIPKPMLRVNGTPILEHIICWLTKNGIIDIGINLFTMPEQIHDYFGNGRKFGVNIYYVRETELSGTAGAIPEFKDWLAGDREFLVVYGDIITNQPIAPLLEMHTKHNAFATLFLHRRKVSNSFIERDADNRIVNFLERPEGEQLEKLRLANPDGFLVNSAVQILSKKALDYIINNDSFDLPRDVYVSTYKTEKIYGVELSGKRVAIDSPERLAEAELIVRRGDSNALIRLG